MPIGSKGNSLSLLGAQNNDIDATYTLQTITTQV